MNATATENIAAALQPGRVAVITGAASGIGLATARKLAGRGLKLVVADREGPALYQAIRDLAALPRRRGRGPGLCLRRGEARRCRKARRCGLRKIRRGIAADEQCRRRQQSRQALGEPRRLEGADRGQFLGCGPWRRGLRAADDRAAARQGIIVNTGSKQGITTPPGNLAYNVSKSALKTYTEGLAHELRNTPGAKLSAHLLIPGFTYTGLTTGADAKPAGAWTGEQVADFMLESLGRGDFYISVPGQRDRAAAR